MASAREERTHRLAQGIEHRREELAHLVTAGYPPLPGPSGWSLLSPMGRGERDLSGSYVLPMAIVVRTAIQSADQEAHDRLDQAVETAIARKGGPPDGLMVHLTYPSGQGFLIVDVWRSENAFSAWWNDVMNPALVEVDLTASEHEINPVWSLARP